MDDYEINSETLAVVPLDEVSSKVIETDAEYIVNKKAMKIMETSCEYFGSSYEGRIRGTKKLTGVTHKSPIIVEESKEIIFFPTSSPRSWSCMWLSSKAILDVEKDNLASKIVFKNGKDILVPASKSSLENQRYRSFKLITMLRERKEC